MNRLEAINSVIPYCDCLADIGCDHGKLSKMVLDDGKAKRVIATDISGKCLDKARKLNAGYPNIEFREGDGLEPLKGETVDVIVIAGMGGSAIMHIIRDLPDCILVLSPHHDAYALREFLSNNNYFINEDFVSCEGNRFYDIIKAHKGIQNLDFIQKTFGVYYKNKNDFLRDKVIGLIEKARAYKPTEKNIALLEAANEVLKWQK